jgi:hypothetical protein
MKKSARIMKRIGKESGKEEGDDRIERMRESKHGKY